MSDLYDYAGAMQRMGNDEELFLEMILILRDDAPRRFREIESGLSSGDLTLVQRAAHSLKGLVANFGAERAQAAAAHVEQLAKRGDREAIPSSLAELREAVQHLVAALEPRIRAPRTTHSST
jgi:HPt (histidine-containing phosphotransfer) domain-containing protein